MFPFMLPDALQAKGSSKSLMRGWRGGWRGVGVYSVLCFEAVLFPLLLFLNPLTALCLEPFKLLLLFLVKLFTCSLMLCSSLEIYLNNY